jgi:hypothetical protein
MIRHIVFFKFKEFAEGADKTANMAKAKDMLLGLTGRVPSLLAMSAGPDVAGPAAEWDFALVADFNDLEALRQYTSHPEHQKVSAFMSKIRAGRASADYEF